MQPSPSAETSRPLFPSLRFCIVLSRMTIVRIRYTILHDGTISLECPIPPLDRSGHRDSRGSRRMGFSMTHSGRATSGFRPMNIQVAPGSRAEAKYRTLGGATNLQPEQRVPGVKPTPAHDLL